MQINLMKFEELIQEKYTNFVFLEKSLQNQKEKLQKLKKEFKLTQKAQSIIQISSQLTQDQFKKDLSDIVSLALKIVFGDNYKFKIRFVQRRNTTEADLLLEENGHEMNPLDSSGFGVADVISIALRMAYWKLQQEARNVMILDEPLRFLSPNLHELMACMIKKISASLGLQLIIITQHEALKNIADNLIIIKKEGEFSFVDF